MTIPTFTPSPAPSPGTGFKPAISLNQADFGDGYSQAGPDGINFVKMTLSLKWDALLPDQHAALMSFFVERGGYQPFYYTAVGQTDPMRFTCKDFSGSASAPWSFSANLVQDFSNAT